MTHPHLTLVPMPVREPEFFETRKQAYVSDDGVYRYSLSRWWCNELPLDLWVMLNPSTADAEVDDPTIRRCMAFSRGWGHGGIAVVNLYAYRTPSPKVLFEQAKSMSHLGVVGPENDAWIDAHLRTISVQSRVIVAWGAQGETSRTDEVLTIIRARGFQPMCLGTTQNGAPRHPLYVRADTRLMEWHARMEIPRTERP